MNIRCLLMGHRWYTGLKKLPAPRAPQYVVTFGCERCGYSKQFRKVGEGEWRAAA